MLLYTSRFMVNTSFLKVKCYVKSSTSPLSSCCQLVYDLCNLLDHQKCYSGEKRRKTATSAVTGNFNSKLYAILCGDYMHNQSAKFTVALMLSEISNQHFVLCRSHSSWAAHEKTSLIRGIKETRQIYLLFFGFVFKQR